ncbi:MAG TPA: xanthine dehydrogenase accessory protein XdhC [Rhizobiales bacterium]|nr:xanthine dehydrogenase accessory protein XdhC [Hyphomicrobiales bacterium]
MNVWQTILGCLKTRQQSILITIVSVKGSAPRDEGTQMLVAADGSLYGTIGGGALEWQAIGKAQKLLAENDRHFCREQEFILGPDLEQCCGGVVRLSFELFTAAELARVKISAGQFDNTGHNLVLFGAGHVGRALVKALAEQPFSIQWIDSRKDIFPPDTPDHVKPLRVTSPPDILAGQPQNTFVLIMTHDHQQDYQIAGAALQNPDIIFTGLIGSATKKARFVRRFADAGLTLDQISQLTCPIGIKGIKSKQPTAIAASVVAQLLIETELVKTGKKDVLLKRNSA